MATTKKQLIAIPVCTLLAPFSLLFFTQSYNVDIGLPMLFICAAWTLLLGVCFSLKKGWKLFGLLPLFSGLYLLWTFLIPVRNSLMLIGNSYIAALNEYQAAQISAPFFPPADTGLLPGLMLLGAAIGLICALGGILLRCVSLGAFPVILFIALGIFTNRFPPIALCIAVVLCLSLLGLALGRWHSGRAYALYGWGLSLSLVLCLIFAWITPGITAGLVPLGAKLRDFQAQSFGTGGFGEAMGESSGLNNHSLVFSGRTVMTVKSDKPPRQPIYIKGSSFGDYTGISWNGLPYSVFKSFSERENFLPEKLIGQGFYFADGLNPPDFMTVSLSRGENVPPHSLYASLPIEQVELLGDVNLSYSLNTMSFRGYPTISFFPFSFEGSPRPLDNYAKFAAEQYTRLPDLPWLPQLSDQLPSNPRELIPAIAQKLSELADYSLSPNSQDFGDDYVGNFLFKQKSGYCQHFASSAVLLLRSKGIPARYATGFCLPPEEFTEDGDGFTANVRDSHAHAWAEIYLADRGWIPVEFTPGGVQAQLDAFNSSFSGSSSTIPSEYINKDEEKPETSPIPSATPKAEEAFQAVHPLFIQILPILSVLILVTLVVLIARYRRKRIIARRFSDTKIMLKDLFSMLEFCLGTPQGDKTDREYLEYAFKRCSVKHIDEFLAAAYKLSYSEQPLSAEEKDLITRSYERAQFDLRPRLSPIKMLIFDYVYCYC